MEEASDYEEMMRGSRSIKDAALASGLYLAATLVLSYPLAFHPTTLSRLDNADAQLNAWAISWVSHQVFRDPLQLFNANTFFPLQNSLAFSEHLFVPALLGAPVLRLSNDLVLTFNIVLLAGMFISAMGMYVLVFDLTRNRTAALLSGLLFSFAPFRFTRLPHLQMQIYGFLPLTLWCLHRYGRSHGLRWAFGFAVFFVLQALCGTYLGAMTGVAAVVAVMTLAVTEEHKAKFGLGLLGAAGLAAAALYPFVRPYLWVHRVLGIEWDLEGVGSMSATPLSYLASASRLYRGLVGGVIPRQAVTDLLFPGLTLLVLAVVGAWVLATRRGGFDHPWRALSCTAGILVAGLLISFGPRTPLYPVLWNHIVLFRGLRALSRFGLLVLLSLSVLAGYGLAWMWNRIQGRGYRGTMAAAAGLLFLAEATVAPLSLTRFEDRPPEVYRWLARRAPDGPFVELPFKRIDTRYMFWARHHGFRPMLNGDSGFIPASHVWMRELFLRFPTPDALTLLRRLHVRYVIVHLGAYRRNPRRLVRLLEDLKRHRDVLPQVASFGRDVVVEVRRAAETDLPQRAGPPIETEGIPPALFDSNLQEPWRAEETSVLVTVSLGELREVRGLRLHYGRSPRMPVHQVEVEALDGRGQWSRLWKSPEDWPALAELVLSLVEDPADGKQTIGFAPFPTRALRLHLRGYDGPPQITELEVLGKPK